VVSNCHQAPHGSCPRAPLLYVHTSSVECRQPQRRATEAGRFGDPLANLFPGQSATLNHDPISVVCICRCIANSNLHSPVFLRRCGWSSLNNQSQNSPHHHYQATQPCGGLIEVFFFFLSFVFIPFSLCANPEWKFMPMPRGICCIKESHLSSQWPDMPDMPDVCGDERGFPTFPTPQPSVRMVAPEERPERRRDWTVSVPKLHVVCCAMEGWWRLMRV
jgi:hypothetical protein